MLENVIENWTSRLDYIRASRGSPMPEIIFKISLECLFGLGAVGKIKLLVQFPIVRAQIPSSEEETKRPNNIAAIGIYRYGAKLKVIPAPGEMY
ncbi:hypothetical protein TNCV_1156881 [Trichonephila clavipes]|nr:hypothetical protein TNCV_1156881 [Trichonephila clavipes]